MFIESTDSSTVMSASLLELMPLPDASQFPTSSSTPVVPSFETFECSDGKLNISSKVFLIKKFLCRLRAVWNYPGYTNKKNWRKT